METMVIASFMLCITLSSLSTIQSSRNSHVYCPISSYLSHHNNQLTTNNLHIYNYPHIYFNISHIQNAEDQFDHGNCYLWWYCLSSLTSSHTHGTSSSLPSASTYNCPENGNCPYCPCALNPANCLSCSSKFLCPINNHHVMTMLDKQRWQGNILAFER